MDPVAVRELARIQSVLHVLKTQRDTLSELSDIQAFRGLEESYRDSLEEAQKLGLAPSDPVSAIRADWLRLIAWSNRIQQALKTADNLGSKLDPTNPKRDSEAGKKRKRTDGEWRPSLPELRQLEDALRTAPEVLSKAIELGRSELNASDWSNGRPYPELAEIADAMDWSENLELSESPGPWAEGLGLRDRVLVASRMAVEQGSQMAERRRQILHEREARVEELLAQFRHHSSALEEVGRLTASGQVETARRLMATVPAVFSDLDYAGKEQKLAQLERRLKTQGESVTETRSGLQELVREAGGFFAFPPIGLLRRGGIASEAAEKVVRETAQLGREGGDSEVDRMVSAWVHGLRSELDSFRALSMGRVRRWILGGAVFWLIALVASGVTFQQIQAKQERERQRVAAEAKAAEDRAMAEAKAKADASKARLVSGGPFEPGESLSLGLPMRWIPAGRFTMGSSSSEEGRDSDESQHEVVLSGDFFLAETECTQGQWEVVMGSNRSHFKGKNLPVEQVSWGEAVEFCRKLTAKQRQEGVLPEGWEWRLPTEAEWEYAARAGTTGARHGELDTIAWHGGNSGSETHGVKGKEANAWGLHDMIGNVWEWCGDWYGDYPTGSVTDPTGPGSGSFRVLRGGSWGYVAGNARSAKRFRLDPGLRDFVLGFRPALSSVR
jgi:formylglycine-generating enzyme required for sulfatase activity